MPEKFNLSTALQVVKKCHSGKILPKSNYLAAMTGLQDYLTRTNPKEINDEFLKNFPTFNKKIWNAIQVAMSVSSVHAIAPKCGEVVKSKRKNEDLLHEIAFLLRVNQIVSPYGKGHEWEEDLALAAVLHRYREDKDYGRRHCESSYGENVARYIFFIPHGIESDLEMCSSSTERKSKIKSYVQQLTIAPIPTVLIAIAVQIDAYESLFGYPKKEWKGLFKNSSLSFEEQLFLTEKTLEFLGSSLAPLAQAKEYASVELILKRLSGLFGRIGAALEDKSRSRQPHKGSLTIA